MEQTERDGRSMERKKKNSRLSRRIDYLSTIEEGWLDGEGAKVSSEATTSAHELLFNITCDDFVAFITIEGGISIEPRNADDSSLNYYEIHPSGRIEKT
jgi:hypothetical protein